MKFFADSAEVSEIREIAELGLADGVTTNPSLIAKSGRPYAEVLREICEIVDGPISASMRSSLMSFLAFCTARVVSPPSSS